MDLIHFRFAQLKEGNSVHELLEMDEAVAVFLGKNATVMGWAVDTCVFFPPRPFRLQRRHHRRRPQPSLSE